MAKFCKQGHDLEVTRKVYGTTTVCGQCRKVYNEKYRRANPLVYARSSRKTKLFRAYGLTEQAFNELLIAQKGGCAVCGSTEWGAGGVPHVDHDHATNEIRGLLCSRCNCGIGMFRDDPELLLEAVRYLS